MGPAMFIVKQITVRPRLSSSRCRQTRFSRASSISVKDTSMVSSYICAYASILHIIHGFLPFVKLFLHRRTFSTKTPPAVDQTAGGVSREKRGKKKISLSLPSPEATLHLHGYYNAFPQKCKLCFVKYILTVSNYSFCNCAYCIVVNILCPSLDFWRNWSIV